MARLDDLKQGLHDKAKGACPSCGADDWDPDVRFVALTETEPVNRQPTGKAGVARAFQCRRCAFIRLHGVSVRWAGN
jgi:hypothetical protein